MSPLRLEAPLDVAGGGVERVEAAAVGADVDGLPPDRGRRVDVAARALRPAQLPARGAEGVDLPVGRADVDAPVRDRRRRVELAAAAEPVLRARPPDHLARAGADRVEIAVVGADEEPVARLRDRALDPALALERPAHAARPLVERVDAAAPVADVDAPVGEERRRLGRADPRPPADLPEAGRERDHLALEPARLRLAVAGRAVHERLVDGVLADRRRGGDAAADRLLPRPLAGLRVDGEHDARVVREVEAPVADRRRELEQLPRAERPDAAERRLQLVRADAVALGVVAEERPGDAERLLGGRRRRRLLLLGRDELLGRGAAHVGRLLALVDDVADDERRRPSRISAASAAIHFSHCFGSTAHTRE